MANIQDITIYLNQGTRNKIVFCKDDIDGIVFVNVGKDLAMLLSEHQEDISRIENMCKQVLGKSQTNDCIGMYLALENIGILFEPELKLDIRSLFNNYSKNQCLIIKSDANITNDKLDFLDNNDNVCVNLQGLSFKQI